MRNKVTLCSLPVLPLCTKKDIQTGNTTEERCLDTIPTAFMSHVHFLKVGFWYRSSTQKQDFVL